MGTVKATAERTSTSSSGSRAQAVRQPFLKPAGGGGFFPPVQTKLTVNKPGDKFEQEADKTADRVMRMATPTAAGADKLQRQPEDKVHRREEERILRAAHSDDKVQKAPAPEQPIQRADKPAAQPAIPEQRVQKADDHRLQKAEASPGKDQHVQRAPDDKLQKAPAQEQPIQRRQEERVQKAEGPHRAEEKILRATDESIQKADDPKLQKKDDDKVQKADDPQLQKAPGTEEKLQRDAAPGGGTPAVGANVQSAIHGKTTGGEPLAADVRGYMEPRFNADFSTVRVHRDAESASLSNQLSARAFTYQNHIFFSRDQYQPGSSEGKHLLAHELTHTIQQGHSVQRAPQISTTPATPTVQRLGLQDALDWFSEKAYLIPGFRLLTLVIGFNPINMQSADRTAANLLRGLIELMPGGAFITQALDNHGIINKAAAWVEAKLAQLGNIGGSIVAALKAFLDSLSWSDIFDLGGVWDRAKRIFTEPITNLISFAESTALELLTMVKDAIKKPLAELAKGRDGYDLLCVLLGEDPISGQPVPRTAENLLGGFMKLIGQQEIWENIQRGGAKDRAYAWFQNALGGLMAMVHAIPQKIVDTISSLSFQDIITVAGAFGRIVGTFASIAGDFFSWALSTIWDLLKIIFDVVKPGLMGYIQRTGSALKSILKNPMPFLGNLVSAAKLGFTNFASNIGDHLKAGIIDWLTGSLQGVYIPKAATLLELGKMALSILGISWTQIRGKFVKALGPAGEKIMSGLELAFDLIKALKDGGVAAVWELIKQKLTDLKDQVISGIVSFVTDTIVKKAIPKIIGMFIPGAGFIPAIISIYDTVMVFVEKLSKIIQVVKAFIDGIVSIAQGNIGPAAAKVESTLSGLLSLAISFLAGFLGLNKVTDKIMGVIQGVRAKVDAAIEGAVNWLVGKAKALFKSMFGGKDSADDRTPEQKNADLQRGVAEGTALLRQNKKSPTGISAQLAPIKAKYRLSALLVVATAKDDGTQKSHIHGAVNPEMDGGDIDTEDDADEIDPQAIWDEVVAGADSLKGKQTKLDSVSTEHARRQIVLAFSDSNVPAAAGNAALSTIDALIKAALQETTGDGITNRMASIGGVANQALAQGGGGVINAHHVQQVAQNKGTFPGTAQRRQLIPVKYKKAITDWVASQKKAGVKGLKGKKEELVGLLRAQLFEDANPNLGAPLDMVEMIVTTAQAHRAAHSAMARDEKAEQATEITAPRVKTPA